MMLPTRISKAALELRPLPLKTLEVVQALKPSRGQPWRLNQAAMPRMMAAEVLYSWGRTSRSPRSTTSMGKPSLWMRMNPSPLGATAAITSRSMLPARTRPCWWSVWLPPISVRPGAEKTAARSQGPKVSSSPRRTLRYRSSCRGAAWGPHRPSTAASSLAKSVAGENVYSIAASFAFLPFPLRKRGKKNFISR